MEINSSAAIVTGGASGMGAETARHLSKLGAKVAVLDVNAAELNQIAEEIGGIGVHCDVSDEESVMHAIRIAKEAHGSARIIVNCAGIVHGKRLVGRDGPMPLHEFKRVIDINLTGSFNVMRLAAADLIAADITDEERGIIINTASIAAFEGQVGQVAYSASKGGIIGMTLPAARELAKFGIRVMAIAPGLVDTPMFAKISDEARAALSASVPFPKRLAKPEEFAFLVEHIIKNSMLNGGVIRLDGALRLEMSG